MDCIHDRAVWKNTGMVREFAMFKIRELFDVSTTKSIDKSKVEFVENGQFDFIGRSSENYGIQGTVNKMEYAPNAANTFSLVQVGESVCLYRERSWYASQNIFILNPKEKNFAMYIFILRLL